jgi:hypothetical protein
MSNKTIEMTSEPFSVMNLMIAAFIMLGVMLVFLSSSDVDFMGTVTGIADWIITNAMFKFLGPNF